MKQKKRRKAPLGRILLSLAGAGVVLLTAPMAADKLSGLTALSAGVSFWSGPGSISDVSGEDTTVSKTLIDGFPINDDAGLMTDAVSSDTEDEEETSSASQKEEKVPDKPDDAGKIIRKTYSGGNSSAYVKLDHGYVRNQTSLSYSEVKKLAESDLPFSLKDTDEPQVLIYHTHATESYMPFQLDWFDKSWKSRSTDDSKNMTAVGDVLEKKLTDAGIGVIHDREHYDASYTGAYDRSRVMIEKTLKKYPSIKVVLDVHRDAIGSDTITAPATTINGKSTAQVMIISCAGTKTKSVPNYKKNLTFACQLQNMMEQEYPTLTRPILFCNRHYNQDLSTGGLLIEVGSHGNTLEEAKNAIGLVGDSLIKLLK